MTKTAPLETCHRPLFLSTIAPPSDAREDLLAHWEDLVFALRPPRGGLQLYPACEVIGVPVSEAEDRKSPAAMELLEEGDQDQVSIKSLPMAAEVSEATFLASAGGERA